MCEAPVMDERATADWEARVADTWATIDEITDARGGSGFRAVIEELAAELPPGSAVADFERASSFDSTGHPDRAVPLYREALRIGLTGERRRRAVIQLASSLRNLGHPQESVALLRAELEAGSDPLDDAVRATLALALTDLGQAREGVSLLLLSLAPHLPRYQRSMANYARVLTAPPEPGPALAQEKDPQADRSLP